MYKACAGGFQRYFTSLQKTVFQKGQSVALGWDLGLLKSHYTKHCFGRGEPLVPLDYSSTSPCLKVLCNISRPGCGDMEAGRKQTSLVPDSVSSPQFFKLPTLPLKVTKKRVSSTLLGLYARNHSTWEA